MLSSSTLVDLEKIKIERENKIIDRVSICMAILLSLILFNGNTISMKLANSIYEA